MTAPAGPGSTPPPEVTSWPLALDDTRLAGRTGRGVKVAVVDSGVNPANPHVGRRVASVGIGPMGYERDDVTDRLGHGTAVVAAILEKAPEADVLSIKVFFEELSTTLPALVAALDRAAAWGADLVNLSLGSPRPEHAGGLEEVVERAAEGGALIVSPREHRGRRWWPGALPMVMGVLLDWDCPRHELRLMEGPHGNPVTRASGYPRPVPGVPRERNYRGISFAAANATGLLALLREGMRDPPSSATELAAHIRG